MNPKPDPPREELLGPFNRNKRDECAEAGEIWNALAAEHDLASVQKLTASRKTKLRARLKDCGGIDGWKAACLKVSKTPWLLGSNDRGWRVDFDFMVSESKFTKLMEGAYDRKGNGTGASPGYEPPPPETPEAREARLKAKYGDEWEHYAGFVA